MSTSVTFRYEFVDAATPAINRPDTRGGAGSPLPPASVPGGKSVFQKLREMRGLARELYASLCGPEKTLEDERSEFSR